MKLYIMSSETVTVRVDPETKKQVRELSSQKGITEGKAIKQFLQLEGQIGPLVRNSGKQQGAIFIASNGAVYKPSKVTVQSIREMLENPYIAPEIEKRLLTFFPGKLIIEALDPKTEVMPEETAWMQQYCGTEDIMLNERVIQAYMDTLAYGPGAFNPVWTRSTKLNEIFPQKLRHLPAWAFDLAPNSNVADYKTWSPLLPGIILNESGEIEYHQRTDEFSYETEQITNILVIKNPLDELISGNSKLVRLYNIIDMLKFVWNTGMQVVNQSGAAFFFIVVTDPQPANEDNGMVSDEQFVNTILSKSSKDMRFQLRQNMQPVQIDMKPGIDILTYEAALQKIIKNFFSIANLVQKDGATIGDSSNSAMEIHNQAATGVHNWLLPPFENWLSQYFYLNGYPDGCRVRLTYKMPEPDRTTEKLEQAKLLAETKMGDIDDIRGLCPDVEPADEKKKQSIFDFWIKMKELGVSKEQSPQQNNNDQKLLPEPKQPFVQKEHSHEGEGEPLDPIAKEIDDELQQEIDELSGAILKGLSI